jgi:hypothetical protein
MNCENIKELLNAYIDNLLSEKERETVHAHIASCPSCKEELDELTQAVNLVRELDRVVPPPWFSEQVMINIKKEEKGKGILSRLFYPLYIKLPVQAFATVVIAVFAIYIYKAATPEMKPLMYPQQVLKESKAVTSQGANEKYARAIPQESDKLIKKPESLTPEKALDQKTELPLVKLEEKPAASLAPESKNTAVVEKKKAATSEKVKERNEIRYDKETPGPKSMEKSKGETVGDINESQAKEEIKDSGAPEMQMRAAPSPVMIDVSVTVVDRDKAIKDISFMLDSMKARVIGKYSTGIDTAILAEARGGDAKKVIEKLRLSGEVSLITKNPDLSGAQVVMRIKVISKGSQVKP